MKNALDGLVNEHRVVVGHINGNVTRQVLFQTGQHLANTFAQLQWIGRRLTNYTRRYSGFTIQANAAAVIGCSFFYFRNVSNFDGKAIDIANGDIAKLRRFDEIGLGCDTEFAEL